MPVQTLDYAPTEFDTGRFVARYLQVLAWLAIAWMIAQPILYDSFRVDVSPIFLFWAASALKRHSPTARQCVLALAGLALAVAVLALTWAATFGTDGMSVSLGGPSRIKNPALWQVALATVPGVAVVMVPFAVLMSARARQQFARRPATGNA